MCVSYSIKKCAIQHYIELSFFVDVYVLLSFGGGSGAVLSDVQCRGNEDSISDCSSSTGYNCSHHKDAGVKCLSGKIINTILSIVHYLLGYLI